MNQEFIKLKESTKLDYVKLLNKWYTRYIKPHEPIGYLLTSAGRIANVQHVFVYKAILEFGGFCDC